MHAAFRRILLGCILLVAWLPWAGVQAQESGIVRVISADVTQFPEVALLVSYTTARGEPVSPPPEFGVTLDGQPVTPIAVRERRLPVAVALVADLSAHMSDRGTPFSRRFDSMQPLIQDLVSRLQAHEQRASLVVFDQAVTVAHPLTHDLGAIGNMVNNSDQRVSFQPAPLAPNSTPYPLGAAIQAALAQLAEADPELPRVLVVCAAGDAASRVDVAALQPVFARARDDRRPIQLLIVGFGASTPGSFTQLAADPEGLQALADGLGGTFLSIGTDPLDEATHRAIDRHLAAVVQRGIHYELRFTARNGAAGSTVAQVSAGDATDRLALDLGALPPRFNVVVDTRSFQDRVRLSIRSEFQQSPLARVEYLLGNRPIAPPVTQGPDFALELDVYDPVFQQRFPPGEYELAAAAWDQNDNQARSLQPILVTVFAPPERAGPLAVLQPYGWLLLGATGLLVAGTAALVLVRRGRATRRPASATAAFPANLAGAPATPSVEPPTVRFGPPPEMGSAVGTAASAEPPTVRFPSPDAAPAGAIDPDATARLIPPIASDDRTLLAPPAGRITRKLVPERRWVIEILSGDATGQRLELAPGQASYSIGRRADLMIASGMVSSVHASLTPRDDGIELQARETTNGTFLGNDLRPLLPGERTLLRPGDLFWLSRYVKLRIVQVNDDEQPD